MCGRYITVSKVEIIEKRFNVVSPQPIKWQPMVNVGPGDIAPVITSERPGELQFFTFGFTPKWAKKPMYIINARSEGDQNKENSSDYSGAKGIIQKPAFRQAIRNQRCLVIADAFIEGPEKEKLNKPYLVYRSDGKRPFAFAGIYNTWVNQETGEILNSFAIITAPANKITKAINHHRSPIILPKDAEQTWLDTSTPLGDITELLVPYSETELNAYPISSEIKNPRNKSLDLVNPVGERIFPEYNYKFTEGVKLQGMGNTTARERKNNSGEQGELFE